MKTNFFKIAVITACIGIAATSCGSSKKVVTTPSTQPQGEKGQTTVQSSETQMKIQDLNNQLLILELERKIEEEKRKNDQASKMDGILEVQILKIPCFDDAIDNEPDKYITGFGIGEPGINDDPFDQNLVYNNALAMARNSIAEKWVGLMKNISNNYYAKTTVPIGNQTSQANFERAVRTGGEKAINEFNAVLCQTLAKTDRGTYVCYLASRVPMEKIKLEIAKELEVLKVKHDQQTLFNTLDSELKNQAEKDQEEIRKIENSRP